MRAGEVQIDPSSCAGSFPLSVDVVETADSFMLTPTITLAPS